MKALKIIAGFFLMIISSCVDTEENIVINADNSGIYSVSIDVGKMIKTINQMGEGNEGEFKGPEKKDSTIYLKDLIQTTDSLTLEEKELYKEGFVHLKVDAANEQMKITVTCPFKNLSQLPEIKENLLKVLDKLKALENIGGKPKDAETSDGKGEMAEKLMAPGNSNNYTFTAEAGKIVNTITNAEDYKKDILSDSLLTAMQQLTTFMGEVTYKTTITTPKEIKNYSGNNAMLSDNKKTISFKNTLTEMIEHPEKLSYKVEY